MGGDFNEVLFDFEKKGGTQKPYHLIDNFRNALFNNNLSSLNDLGPPFTWDNGRTHSNNVMERLDIFVVNDTWRNYFPNSSSTNLDYYSSDHRAIQLNTNYTQNNTDAPLSR